MTTQPSSTETDRTLLAICLNPPSQSSGVRTERAVAAAATAFGCNVGLIANLCMTPTATVVDLNRQPAVEADWTDHRENLAKRLESASVLVGAWGVTGLTGDVRQMRDRQVVWLLAKSAEVGHEYIRHVGGEARHPSRWHQYVSDKHERTTGGSFDRRLAEIMRPTRLSR